MAKLCFDAVFGTQISFASTKHEIMVHAVSLDLPTFSTFVYCGSLGQTGSAHYGYGSHALSMCMCYSKRWTLLNSTAVILIIVAYNSIVYQNISTKFYQFLTTGICLKPIQ